MSSSTTNEPNFKIVCNCIHELLNVFEGSAQREHTISRQGQLDIDEIVGWAASQLTPAISSPMNLIRNYIKTEKWPTECGSLYSKPLGEMAFCSDKLIMFMQFSMGLCEAYILT